MSNTPQEHFDHVENVRKRLIDFTDIEEPSGDPPTMLGHYILPGCIHWLSAPTGIGKTTLAFNIALAISTGAELWDLPTVKKRVLYIDAESGNYLRAKKCAQLRSLFNPEKNDIFFMEAPPKGVAEQMALVKLCQQLGIGLVVFDTVRRCFNVENENDNAEFYFKVAPLLDKLKAVGIASLIIGHTGKSGGIGARGAGAQEDAADVNMSLGMAGGGQKNDPNGIVSLVVTKHRVCGLGIPPLNLRRIGSDRFEPTSEQSATLDVHSHEKPTTVDMIGEEIIEFVLQRPTEPKHVEIVEAMQALGHKEGSIKPAISKLTKEGVIFKTANGYTVHDPTA